MEEERKRLDGEVEERVRAVQRIADKNEDDKIVFQGEKHSIWMFNENQINSMNVITMSPSFR